MRARGGAECKECGEGTTSPLQHLTPDRLTLAGTPGRAEGVILLGRRAEGRRVPPFPTPSFPSSPQEVEEASRTGIWAGSWAGEGVGEAGIKQRLWLSLSR